MRKLSTKWPVRVTVIAWMMPVAYWFFRVVWFRKPEIFFFSEFGGKVFAAVSFSIISWVVYGIACLFARTWVNCGNCKFSDVIQDSKEMKCRLTDYNYPITYSCKKSKPKEVEGVKDSTASNC